MKKFKLNLRQIRLFVFGLIFILLAGQIGYWLGAGKIRLGASRLTVAEIKNELSTQGRSLNFDLFWEVWEELEKSYLDQKKIDPQTMIYGAIKGMVAALDDPYTVFLPPEENRQAQGDLNGSFEGIGIELGYKDDYLAVVAPLDQTPAKRAGIKAGDLILKIEDQETIGISLPEAVRLIRGPRGSTVKLTLLHEGEADPYEVLITRETIVVPSVEVAFLSEGCGSKSPFCRVAHLKLTRFGERTEGEWDQAVDQILNQPEISGVILDLRNNPGGYLSGSVFIASEFLTSGTVVIQEDAQGNQENYRVNRTGQLTKVPLVVLVNQGSASASEIVAGALQKLNRAKVVGEPTFGKGTIQEAHDLREGSGLHVTVYRWLLPSGQSVDKEGLVPDNQIEDNPETEADEQLQKALSLF